MDDKDKDDAQGLGKGEEETKKKASREKISQRKVGQRARYFFLFVNSSLLSIALQLARSDHLISLRNLNYLEFGDHAGYRDVSSLCVIALFSSSPAHSLPQVTSLVDPRAFTNLFSQL